MYTVTLSKLPLKRLEEDVEASTRILILVPFIVAVCPSAFKWRQGISRIIDKIIEQNFKPDTTMSVGYRDGQFALLFCEVVDEVEKEEAFLVKVFATGDAAAYDAVEAYINKFMDCELE